MPPDDDITIDDMYESKSGKHNIDNGGKSGKKGKNTKVGKGSKSGKSSKYAKRTIKGPVSMKKIEFYNNGEPI